MADNADVAGEGLAKDFGLMNGFTTTIPTASAARAEPKPVTQDPILGSEDAPYGYKPDGTPYRRRPRGMSTAGGPGVPARTAKTQKDAEDAAAVLVSMNDLLATGMMMGGLHETARQWIEDQERFRTQAVAALENDPALCKSILRTGAKGGKVALLLAYCVLIGGVSASASAEMKAIKVRRAEDAAAAQGDV